MSFLDSEPADEPEDEGGEEAGPNITSHNTASTAIANLTYDHDENTLFITFTDGRRYVVAEFPEIELDRWLGSASIGGYFNAFVRGNY